ncbi:hypothetical protein [Nocardia asteroides]|uniref:hypothetical protein n=1 Tax=Nocardia asteroides TaxID=1824 RepID=UPI001E508892|nr:hypothetical protein [Nocardia asteroides]UGT58968.1 hypothetical protein LTT61_16830 [Nocardia asteroides]
MAWFLGLSVLVALGLYGCQRATYYAVDQMKVPDVEESLSPELLQEATDYGDWVLPSDSSVLLVKRETIRDRKYQIAVRTTHDGFAAMLEQSRFPAQFNPRTRFGLIETIAGPPLASSPRVEQAQEAWFTSAAGEVMIRDVTVDMRDENTLFVHIEFRGV